MQMMALYFPVEAKLREIVGISNAPGTRTTSMSFLRAPVRSSASHALSNNRSVINELNRETTIAKRLPEASSFPSTAENAASGTDSTLNLISSVIPCAPCGAKSLSVKIRANPCPESTSP